MLLLKILGIWFGVSIVTAILWVAFVKWSRSRDKSSRNRYLK